MPKEWVQGCLWSRKGHEVPAGTRSPRLLRYSEVGEHVLVVGCALGSIWELAVTLILCLFVLLLGEFSRQHSMWSMSVVSPPGEDAVQFQFCSSSSHRHPVMASVSLLPSRP